MKITEISYSSMNEYMSYCPLKWHYRKVLNLEPEFVSAEMVYGSGFHNALEAFFVARLEEKDLGLKPMVELFAESFTQPNIKYNGQPKDELILEAAELLTMARQQNYGRLLGVELPIEVKLAGDMTLTGFIDLLTIKNDGKRVITDFKTAKRRPSEDDVAGHQQLSTYSLAFPDAELQLSVFLKQKTPAVENYPTKRNHEQRKRTVKTLIAVAQSMEKECWYPREGFWCNGCGYQEQCKKDF